MEKAIEKENYLTEDERVLINKFIAKIKNELNSAENNQIHLINLPVIISSLENKNLNLLS